MRGRYEAVNRKDRHTHRSTLMVIEIFIPLTNSKSPDEDTKDVSVSSFLNDGISSHEELVRAKGFDMAFSCCRIVAMHLKSIEDKGFEVRAPRRRRKQIRTLNTHRSR